MKRLKKWLALVLAVALLGANVIYSLGSELKANELEGEQPEAQPESTVETGQQKFSADGVDVEVADSGPDLTGQEEGTAGQEQAGQGQAAQEQQQVSEPVQPEAAVPSSSEEDTTDVVQHKVTFKGADTAPGSVVMKTVGETVEIDLSEDYEKQIEEASSVTLAIRPDDGYEIRQVTVNGTVLDAMGTEDGTSTYEMREITEDKMVEISFDASAGASGTPDAVGSGRSAVPEGNYTITYKVAGQFQNAYQLTKGGDGKTYTTDSIACEKRLTSFGVWLKTKSGTAVMPVTMTLANDVTGTDTNGNPVRYTRGTVISKLDGRNAKVVMPYSHTYFKADSKIQIEVAPAEEATYQVTYHVADGYRDGYTLTGNGASGLDYTRYSQWCSSRFTSFGVWLKAGNSQVMPVKMTLSSEAKGTDDKGNPVAFAKGSVISELRTSGNGQTGAYVCNGFNFTYFEPDSDIHIQVEPALFKVHTEHYLEQLDGSYRLEDDVEGDVYDPGTEVEAEQAQYTGYAYNPDAEGTVAKGTVTGLESLVLKLYYDRNVHEVSYVIDGKADAVKETHKYGDKVTLREVPAKAGYDFDGWNVDQDFDMPDEDVTIYGSFVARGDTPYRVEHYKEGLDGSYVLDANAAEDRSGKTGDEVTAVPIDFEGFDYNPDAQGSKAAGTVSAEEELVLRLYYDRKNYQVIYQQPDGQRIAEPDTYLFGEQTGELKEAPEKTGYSFGGWNIDALPETMPAADIVVEGSYDINSYSVTYMVDGEIYGMPVMHEYSSTVTPDPEPVKRGFRFSGWNHPYSFDMPAENIVIEGTFEVNSYDYTVQYYYGDVLDESRSMSAQAEYGTTVAAQAPETAEYDGQRYRLSDGTYELLVSDKPEENIISVQYKADTDAAAAGTSSAPASASPPAPDAVDGAVTPANVVQTIFEPVTTLAGRVADSIADYQKTVQSEDEEVPLADGGKTSVQSQCILHFFIILAAFVLELFYIRSRKKEQLKYFAMHTVSAHSK
ncbi:InlB B-repeat-containing protein [Dorea sp. D27]|uniref:InlB B-repeat-containing protein n=1 Tax=Dorea sp. D27 TaxID=658665 RepID=UPI0006730AD8|nr:InlB B-repeat-containing protein [Dorea sp. D27]KMZ53374.1 hypothetical protein HMPREF0980_02617 [Dorea sp. D27]